MVAEPSHMSFLDLYIPANPFYAMANTIVPAIVVFSIFLGVAMITVNKKDGFILGMQNLSDALMKMASVVAKLAPIGIFALSAAAAGTLDIEKLSRLQIYLWVYLAAWTILSFFALPMLVARATPFSYKDVFKEARLAMVTAFATGTVLVVLPMIAEKTKALLEKRGMKTHTTVSAVDALVPTAYSFPSVGTILGIGFILFAAWFVGSPINVADYPAFCIMGILTAFGSMAVAIPFMLDFFRLPADLFGLYLLGSVFTMRFATAMAAMHGVVICILGACAMLNKTSWRKMIGVAGLSLAITAATMTGLGFVLKNMIPYEYTGYRHLINMELLTPQVKVNNNANPAPLPPDEMSKPRLKVIKTRGVLRVGYAKDRLPFAFKNAKGQVVGYDMELVHSLAKDLGVSLDVVKIDWSKVGKELDSGRIDMAVGGISISPQRALRFTFSKSYLDEHLGLVVHDYRRNDFSSLDKIRSMKGLRLGATPFRYKEGAGQMLFPNAEIVVIHSPRDFFRGSVKNVDAMLYTAQTATAWTLVYPEFTVVVPKGLKYKCPMAFAMPKHQLEWLWYIDTWLDAAVKAGLGQRAYDHWILGKIQKHKSGRWSVIKDVLKWTD
ncbi:MAG: sodium:dicarboxylate symporter [Thermodesulfatator sp.]|nr:MAG: sodium:dicarboxylate symporter [Thermodesulfatator sp.]